MTIERKLRIDALGRETQFIVIDDCITNTGRTVFETKLTELALGYTKFAAVGGWRGKEEATTVYRVASLSMPQVIECAELLLDARWSPAIGRIMRDVYVVLPSGEAIGVCYEYPEWTIDLPTYHGMVARAPRKLNGTRPDYPAVRMPLANDPHVTNDWR